MELYSFSDQEPLVEAFLSSCSEAGHALVDDVNGPVEEGAGDMNVKASGDRLRLRLAMNRGSARFVGLI